MQLWDIQKVVGLPPSLTFSHMTTRSHVIIRSLSTQYTNKAIYSPKTLSDLHSARKNRTTRVVPIPLFTGSKSGSGIAKRLKIRIWGLIHNTSIGLMILRYHNTSKNRRTVVKTAEPFGKPPKRLENTGLAEQRFDSSEG